MSLRISFELGPADVKHFRDAMRKARHTVRDAEEADILDAARGLFGDVQGKRVPAYVRERVERLKAMVEMIEDPEWHMSRAERERVLAALVYFCDPEDLIPDHIPGLGFLDDAIMIELVFVELRHEVEAYQDFREYRRKYDTGFHLWRDPAKRKAKLAARETQLRERSQRRQQKGSGPVL